MQIKVTPDLKWVPCYDDFVCTKLQVPLDYEDPSAGTTHVSFIKWYTPNSSSTNKDILLNPGGPGASGVYFLRNELPALRSIVGEANNLVSFDPRGIGASGPADVSCSLGNDTISEPDTPFLDVNDGTSYAKVYAAAATLGDWLTRTHSCENDTAKYVNTVGNRARHAVLH
jgi:pimeloyl-ACP methyl ester carboxylesterase